MKKLISLLVLTNIFSLIILTLSINSNSQINDEKAKILNKYDDILSLSNWRKERLKTYIEYTILQERIIDEVREARIKAQKDKRRQELMLLLN